MDYIISRRLSSERLYAYSKGRFWFWDDLRGIWKESHLMAQKFERAKSAIATLTPEEFLGNSAEFEQPDEYELNLTMVDALKDAKPCKTAPIEPVDELHSPSAQCSDAATAAESQTAASPAAPEGSSPTTETANAAKSSDSQGNAVGENAALSAISGSSSDKPLTTIPDDLRPTFDFSALGSLSEQATEADQQFDLHYRTAQDEYLISCIYLARIHSLTAKAGRYGGGTWTKWYESKGLSHGSVTKMVQNGEAFNSSTVDELKQLPELTRKDLNLIARSGCAEQLVAAAGDSQRVQELLTQLKEKDAQLKLSDKRIDELQAHSDKLTHDYNDEFVKRRQAESELDATRARLKSACVQEQESREAMQAAESARDAALADVQGLSEQNRKLKDENASLKKQPITAVIDEEEVDKRAGEKAYQMAADMTAELKADRDELQRQLDEAHSAPSVDPQEDLENVIACRVNLESAWSMARSCSTRLVGSGENLNNALHAIISLCDSIHKEAVALIIRNDKETQYE